MTLRTKPPIKPKTPGVRTPASKAPARRLTATAPAQADATSLVEQIYSWLESMIVTLELPPGALLSELEIGRRFGVSRTPVGEALQRLAREGLVTILPRRGIVVTEVSVSEQLRLLEFRREITKFIARTGAKRANAQERQALRRVAEAFVQAADQADDEALLVADKEFHDLFAVCAHNNFAIGAIGPLDSLSRRFYYAHKLDVGNIHVSAKLHADIALAIAEGDAQAAEGAANAMADYLDEFARSTLD